MNSICDRTRGNSIRVYFNVLKNNLSHIFNFPVYPRFAHIFVTRRCNLKCQGCAISRRENEKELSSVEFSSIFKKIKFLDVVKITGGEPFIREDLPVIVNEIKKSISPYMIQVTTNGTYTDRIIELVKKEHSSSLHLRISLDGLDDVYENIRQGSSYSKVKETILTLVELKKEYPFHLGINYGLRSETIPFMERIFKFCRKNKINLILGYPVKPFLEDIDFDMYTINADMPEVVIQAYRKFIHHQKSGKNFLEYFFSNFLNKTFFNDDINNNLSFDCGELRDLAYIFPNGDLATCGLRQKKVGNLLDENFKDIWFGEKIKKYRQEVKNCPGCMQKSIKLISKVYKFL